MTPRDPEACADALHAAFNIKDMEALKAIWADDIEYVGPAGMIRGQEARVAAERVWFDAFPDAKVEVQSRFSAGVTVVEIGRMVGAHAGPLATPEGVIAATGATVSGRFASIMEIEDGRVVRQQIFFDRLALLEQIGVMGAAE